MCVQVYQVLESVLKEKVKAEDHLKVTQPSRLHQSLTP